MTMSKRFKAFIDKYPSYQLPTWAVMAYASILNSVLKPMLNDYFKTNERIKDYDN